MDDELLHVGDGVRHKGSKMVGTVDGFAHDGTLDVMVDGTGPYPQRDFEKLQRLVKAGEPGGPELPEPDSDGFTCHCQTFSECTHK